MKKALKIFGIIFLLLIVSAFAAPIIFKDKFKEMIKESINENVNAQVDFNDLTISLFKNFPKASVEIEGLLVTNFEPFKGDTLVYTKNIGLVVPLNSLMKSKGEGVIVQSFTIDDALVNIISNEDGVTNYDIAKKGAEEETTSTSKDEAPSNFNLLVDHYAINNAAINYIDEASKMKLSLTEFNHSGNGDLSASKSTLKTVTRSNISMIDGDVHYFDDNKLALDADLEIDQVNSKYSFLKNTFKINQLELNFDGYFQQHVNHNSIDLTFKTPTSDFKNFIALLPEAYSKDINNIKTNGSFAINGFAKGIIDDHNIPKFNVEVTSEKASLKYPDLPKSIENINLIAALGNATGKSADTFFDLKKLSLQIDQDVFNANALIKKLTENPAVNADLKGTLNLGNLSKAYPIQMDNTLKGILNADLQTAFTQSAIENNQYERIKNNGSFSLKDFEFASKDVVNPVLISEAAIQFDPKRVTLQQFNAKSGDSDIQATGTLDNLFGFLFSDKKLKGDFNMTSSLFKISDFMVDNTSEEENTNKESETGEALKIPDFIDARISADAKRVVYDDLTLNNVKGNLSIKDQTASLQNLTTEMFGGRMAIDGNVSTKNEKPSFALDLGIDQFDISQSFNEMGLLSSLAPIAKLIEGKLNTMLKVSGNLDNEFGPDLSSITGNALAEILTTKIKPQNSEAFSMLNNQLSFIDLDKLDLKKLKTALSFEEGRVKIKPFDVRYEDINITVSGAHGFDKSLKYNATFDVPAKYFGKEVGGLLSKFSSDDIKDIKVPVVANIGGTIMKPQVNTDLKQSVSKLTQQLVKAQKDKLLGQGGDAIKDLVGDIFGGGKKDEGESNGEQTPDTTNNATNQQEATEENIKDLANDVLDIFGKKKKKKDSTDQ